MSLLILSVRQRLVSRVLVFSARLSGSEMLSHFVNLEVGSATGRALSAFMVAAVATMVPLHQLIVAAVASTVPNTLYT